jgi:uncharacterized protein YdaU (DUF1376 family)
MADLTRFDFHALRFTKSLSIMAMSNEEIGQYILLLCEAWLGGRNTTLPNDPEILARLARCKKVSDKVLTMFPVVEEGIRRNETLFGEWMATTERLGTASAAGRKGNDIRWAANRVAIATQSDSDGAARETFIAQTRPDQTDSDQTSPNQSTSFGQGTFKNIAIQYSSYFGVHHSKSKKHLERYQKACSQYGEERVLEYFQRWVQTAGWLKEKHDSNGLNFFWRPMEEIAEGDEVRIAREQKQNEPEVPAERVVEAMVGSLSERTHAVTGLLEAIKKQKEFEEAHKDEI